MATNQYIRYPTVSGGIQTYANFAAFPASAADGTVAIALDTDILYVYNIGSAMWVAIGGPGDILTMGAFGSSPNANGGVISAGVLTLEPADGTHPGGVSTTTQTFAGNKTFTGTISASNLSGTNTGNITLTAVGAAPSANGASLSGQALTLQPADGTHPGALTSGAQTIGGNKTLTGTISASNLSGTNTGDQTIALTSDVTGSGTGSFATTIAAIQGKAVSGTTGTGNVVFSAAPTLTDALTAASGIFSLSLEANTLVSDTTIIATAGNITASNGNIVSTLGSVMSSAFVSAGPIGGTYAKLDNSDLFFYESGSNTSGLTDNGAGHVYLYNYVGAKAIDIYSDGTVSLGSWNNSSPVGELQVAPGGPVSISTNLILTTAGSGIQIKTGSNARAGTAVLVGGTVTVANTSVTANTLIFYSVKTPGGTQGFLSTASSVGTSFTINSTSIIETSTIVWMLVEGN